jgi:integrase
MRAGEILALTWDRVDQDEGFIRLEPGTTKTGEGRQIPLMGDLPQVLEAWWLLTRSKYPNCPWVVHYRGRRVKSLYKRAWASACERTGLTGKLFHDFRRTAIRNMVRAGISEHVAMKISGHKTRSVFDRYDIVTEGDLKEAARRMNRQMSTVSSTATDWLEDKKQLAT